MTRRTPQEDAVRDEMQERTAAGEDNADGGTAEKDSAAAAQPAPDPAERVQPDEPAAETPPEPEPDPLAKAEAERDQYLELARRTQADFENYRKRVARDVAAAGARAKVGLVRDLLPVVDNLERALASENGDGAEGHVAAGVRLVLSELQAFLAREGVKALEPVGEPFDPTVHEALSTRAQEGAAPGVVLDVVEKGYRMNDTVIRPARVVVSA